MGDGADTAPAQISYDEDRDGGRGAEDSYLATFDEGLDRLSRAVEQACEREPGWLERLRAGVVAMLGFFDDEPAWTRVLVVDAPASGAVALACHQRLHDLLDGLLDTGGIGVNGRVGLGRDESADEGIAPRRVAGVTETAGTSSPALTAELVAGGVFSVIRTSLLEGDGGKLVELAPSLMAFIVAPYLGQAAARLELEGRPAMRGTAVAHKPGFPRSRELQRAAIARTAELPIRVTHRTTLVLRAIARAPYSNNRGVAQAAGIADEGQASKLLARLEQRGVIENVGVGPARGEPNAWLLTPSGRRAVELIGESYASGAPRPRRSRSEGVA